MGDTTGRPEEEVYEVEEVLDVRQRRRSKSKPLQNEYLIRWKGYGPEENTWEPLENLQGCEEALAEFEAKRRRLNKGKTSGNGATELTTPSPPRQYLSVLEESASKTLEAAEIITRRRLQISPPGNKDHNNLWSKNGKVEEMKEVKKTAGSTVSPEWIAIGITLIIAAVTITILVLYCDEWLPPA